MVREHQYLSQIRAMYELRDLNIARALPVHTDKDLLSAMHVLPGLVKAMFEQPDPSLFRALP
jgi:hypothetical protein